MEYWNSILAAAGLEHDALSIKSADTAAELAAARSGAIMVPLVHLRGIAAEGEDATDFLHNLFSNDVRKLPDDAAQWTSFNSPKGRMLASMLLWHADGGYRLVMAADVHEGILKKLRMFVLRSKVALQDCGEARALLGVSCDALAECLAKAGLPVPAAPMKCSQRNGISVVRLDARRALVDLPAEQLAEVWARLGEQGVRPAGTAAWHWLDVQCGIPLITQATQDDFVAQMLNYEIIGGVNFKKGCYPGQEIVARTQYLGKLKKRMYRLLGPGNAPAHVGDELFAPAFGDQAVGKLVTVAPAPNGGIEALAVLQIQAADEGQIFLGSLDGTRLRLASLPYPLDVVPVS
ncbi:folate-binding protein YgfZ [Nitrogeniibacter mangrovi]|uniref:Folate-binding protein YgfZ n=1 Tax=Nitrogeniibacter mangrovi TaxID=2016596 RepID=A0A6C1B2S8_9RHOO|nr:folate-binding protein YgfZ [Nitrogeniibacter mangrovi]QID17952.1 folate-binding protein YgfZ [Nitrogeniibacter mangrovi]